jgi:glycine hydroxymethyltransferase
MSGRIGTNEMTRIGMKEDEMVDIARFMERGYFHRENKKNLRKEIIDFKDSFKTEKFCF